MGRDRTLEELSREIESKPTISKEDLIKNAPDDLADFCLNFL